MIALDVGGMQTLARLREGGAHAGGVSIWPATRYSLTAATHAFVVGTLMLATVWAMLRSARSGVSMQTLWLTSLLVIVAGMVPLAVGLAWVFSRLAVALLLVAFLAVRAVRAAR